MYKKLLTPFDESVNFLDLERPDSVLGELARLGVDFEPAFAFGSSTNFLDRLRDIFTDIFAQYDDDLSFDAIVQSLASEMFQAIDPTLTQSDAGSYTSGASNPSGYNIKVLFEGDWSETMKQGMRDVLDLISANVLGDLPDVNGIDDLEITANIGTIDGMGGTVGYAGPTSVRSATALPIRGQLQLDVQDVDAIIASGNWEDLLFHEVMHTLGFGIIWSTQGLVQDFNGDLRFTGQTATEVYNRDFPDIAAIDSLSLHGVPIETHGGTGTAGSHWDEGLLGDEIMTGYLQGDNTFSDLSFAALQDMGYETVLADEFLFT